MSLLETWLEELRKGALEPSAFRRTVREALASGAIDRATLRRWLAMPAARAALPRELVRDLAELLADQASRKVVDPERNGARRPGTPEASGPESQVGSVIDGRYQLLALLGRGGMGDVFKALDLLAHKQQDPDPYVAIKILKPKLQGNQTAALALQREANRARRITHPNILRIHQFEQDRKTGVYFIVMELLVGSSLADLLQQSWAGQSWGQISGYLAQICAGLQCAHEEGIIHSDIKPGNLFITHRGQVKILDFGIAAPLPRLFGESHHTLLDARKLGARTPAYASLETFLGMKAHYSDDVYSLACVTYEWLSGAYPYVKSDDPHVPLPAPAALKLGVQPAPLRGLTAAQNRALRKALALRRTQRTQTIAEFWHSMTAKRSSWPLRQIATVAAAALLAGVLILGAVRFLPHRHAAPPAAAVRTLERGAPMVSQPGADPPVSSSLEAPALTGCPGPASQATLDAALSVGLEAEAFLAQRGKRPADRAQARSRLRAARQCLRALASAGVSNADSARLLGHVRHLTSR